MALNGSGGNSTRPVTLPCARSTMLICSPPPLATYSVLPSLPNAMERGNWPTAIGLRNCRLRMSKTSMRFSAGLAMYMRWRAVSLSMSARPVVLAPQSIGQNRAARFRIAAVLEDTHRRDDVDGFGGLNQHLIGCRRAHGARRRGAELRRHIAAVGPAVARMVAVVAVVASACAVTVIRPPPILRTGMAAVLSAAVTPHWSVASRATSESGIASGRVRNVPSGSTMKPDCEMA